MTSTYNRRKIKESLFVLRMLIIPLINLAVCRLVLFRFGSVQMFHEQVGYGWAFHADTFRKGEKEWLNSTSIFCRMILPMP